MRQLKLFRWAAALTLAIALAPGAASAQEDDTITISSTFYMDWLDGTVGPDLAEVYANGHEHTWTLTLHGTTQSHSTLLARRTTRHGDSRDVVRPRVLRTGRGHAQRHRERSHRRRGRLDLSGERLLVEASATTSRSCTSGRRVPTWTSTQATTWESYTLFPTDADGYPVVGPEPFSIWPEYSELSDMRPGNDGGIESRESLVTFEGSVGEPPGEPVVLAVADASVLEGNRGTSNVAVAVTLSSASSQAITVSYRTVDGTAKAKAGLHRHQRHVDVPARRDQPHDLGFDQGGPQARSGRDLLRATLECRGRDHR